MPDALENLARMTRTVRIKKIDADRRIVFGEVYAPDTLDTYKEFMTAEDIETMAHRFMRLELGQTIDTNHDNEPNGSYPVESFIARKGDPDFTEGAWVLGVKVPDPVIWHKVKRGELNGFSFQALVQPVMVTVERFLVRDHVGQTEPPNDDPEGHTHLFFVQLDENGRIVQGFTSVVEGHDHRIRRGTSTEPGGEDKHSHRFFL